MVVAAISPEAKAHSCAIVCLECGEARGLLVFAIRYVLYVHESGCVAIDGAPESYVEASVAGGIGDGRQQSQKIGVRTAADKSSAEARSPQLSGIRSQKRACVLGTSQQRGPFAEQGIRRPAALENLRGSVGVGSGERNVAPDLGRNSTSAPWASASFRFRYWLVKVDGIKGEGDLILKKIVEVRRREPGFSAEQILLHSGSKARFFSGRGPGWG